MRLVGYRCEDCEKEHEEYFNDTEEKPETLNRGCDRCGGKLLKYDLKTNEHRYRFLDSGIH